MFLLDTILGDERYAQSIQGWSLSEEQGRALINAVLVLAALIAIYLVYRVIERIVCHFLPAKTEVVIVERTHFNQVGNKIKVKNVATGKKRIVLLRGAQFDEGSKGELVRQGRYGISFTPEAEEETKDLKKYYQKNKFKK
jgi:hypothetical protein